MLSLRIIADAKASHAKFYPRGCFVSVALAQFICESNWGTQLSGTFNPFGIKANSEQIVAGKYTVRSTLEQLPSGQYVRIAAKFANYDSFEEAFDAHNTLLTSRYYWRCIQATTPEEYCQALHDSGYATEHDYASILMNIIRQSDLTQYD